MLLCALEQARSPAAAAQRHIWRHCARVLRSRPPAWSRSCVEPLEDFTLVALQKEGERIPVIAACEAHVAQIDYLLADLAPRRAGIRPASLKHRSSLAE
jgi:hypothetical protein